MSRLKPNRDEVEETLQLLASIPARIARAAAGQSEPALRGAPDANNWSAVEVLAHLRGCADLWTYSIYAMLVVDTPTLADLHPRRWARVVGYAALDFDTSFQAFQLQRGELLKLLQSLPESAWERTGRIGDREHSVFSQAHRMAQHEAGHCEQIEALFARTISDPPR